MDLHKRIVDRDDEHLTSILELVASSIARDMAGRAGGA